MVSNKVVKHLIELVGQWLRDDVLRQKTKLNKILCDLEGDHRETMISLHDAFMVHSKTGKDYDQIAYLQGKLSVQYDLIVQTRNLIKK